MSKRLHSNSRDSCCFTPFLSASGSLITPKYVITCQSEGFCFVFVYPRTPVVYKMYVSCHLTHITNLINSGQPLISLPTLPLRALYHLIILTLFFFNFHVSSLNSFCEKTDSPITYSISYLKCCNDFPLDSD